FFAIVAAWSAAAAWFVYRKKHEGIEAFASASEAPAGATAGAAPETSGEASESIASAARSYSILLSEDAIEQVRAMAAAENCSAASVLASIAAKAGKNGEWIALSKEKLLGLN